jgi:hypothetical protein
MTESSDKTPVSPKPLEDLGSPVINPEIWHQRSVSPFHDLVDDPPPSFPGEYGQALSVSAAHKIRALLSLCLHKPFAAITGVRLDRKFLGNLPSRERQSSLPASVLSIVDGK